MEMDPNQQNPFSMYGNQFSKVGKGNYKNKRARDYSDSILPAMAGISAIGRAITEPGININDEMAADNVFSTNNMNADLGMWQANNKGIIASEPVQFTGYKYGGDYQMGGEYYLTDEEIDYILRNGGELDFLD